MKKSIKRIGRASLLTALALGATLALADLPKVKVGLMLPYSGTYAGLGNAITNGFKQFVTENGGKLGGREVQYFVVDDESDPAKATDNAMKLIKHDDVDVLVGTVHSGVALAMAKVAREHKTLMIVPNAGADELTGASCDKNLFRTSFSMWQPAYAMGTAVAALGHKRIVTLTWKYAAGQQAVDGFREAYEKEKTSGGKIIKELTLPFPSTDFQPFLAEIAALKPDAVYVFFAGGGAVKFVKDYAAAGLKTSIPLYAPGFLTDGTIDAMGEASQGLLTALHYGDGIDSAKNNAFRLTYAKTYKAQPDVYAVQGYDAAQVFHLGLTAVKGDVGRRSEMIKAMEAAKINSPRGPFSFSASHNPVQNIYLRKVAGRENKVFVISEKSLEDPARSCHM